MFVIYHALPLCRTCGVLEERTENVDDVIRDAWFMCWNSIITTLFEALKSQFDLLYLQNQHFKAVGVN